ncbi:MAG: spondin domain-containing protein [Candidatus Omnitrophica bacterium]|nr:spondin domain-containing protein [Candidatus Omnitrophota bacterium]
MVNKYTLSSVVGRMGLALLGLLCVVAPVIASVSIPPVIIVGSLQTPGGYEISTGNLRFEFVPDQGGASISVDAEVGSFEGGMNFYVFIPIKAAPLPIGSQALELGAGKTYTAHVYYNGEEIADPQIQLPYTPIQGSTLGPVQYIVEPKGPALSVSRDIDFGYVPVGANSEDSFQIVNVGTESINGSARLANGNLFTLREGNENIGVIPFNLNPGESQMASVRFAPTISGDRLTDSFNVRSNAGEITRTLRGNSSTQEPTPTPTPLPGPFQLEIDAPASVTGVVGTTTEIEASVILTSALDPVEGWYLGVCTGDSSLCAIREIQVGDAVAGTEVFDIEIENESTVCSGMEGKLAILLDPVFDPPLLPNQIPLELMKIHLQINFSDQPGESECLIDFVDGLRLSSLSSPNLNLETSNQLRIGGLPFGTTHGLQMSGASIEILTLGPETPTPTMTPTATITPTSEFSPTPTPSVTPTVTATLDTAYDIAPDLPDGVVNSLDLIRWVELIGGKIATPDMLFDFSRFWTRSSRELAGVAAYEVTFDGTWSEATHPTDFPMGGRFTGLIGGTHNPNVTFWEENGLASPGIEAMAETGSKSFLAQEINVAIQGGRAGSVISGGAISPTPDTVSVSFVVSREFPLVTLVSQIAPSPDWFVGVTGVSLLEEGIWKENLVLPLLPYDAGTDSGGNYASPDEDTLPQEPIQRIEGGPFLIGETVPPVGTFSFRRID